MNLFRYLLAEKCHRRKVYNFFGRSSTKIARFRFADEKLILPNEKQRTLLVLRKFYRARITWWASSVNNFEVSAQYSVDFRFGLILKLIVCVFVVVLTFQRKNHGNFARFSHIGFSLTFLVYNIWSLMPLRHSFSCEILREKSSVRGQLLTFAHIDYYTWKYTPITT